MIQDYYTGIQTIDQLLDDGLITNWELHKTAKGDLTVSTLELFYHKDDTGEIVLAINRDPSLKIIGMTSIGLDEASISIQRLNRSVI